MFFISLSNCIIQRNSRGWHCETWIKESFCSTHRAEFTCNLLYFLLHYEIKYVSYMSSYLLDNFQLAWSAMMDCNCKTPFLVTSLVLLLHHKSIWEFDKGLVECLCSPLSITINWLVATMNTNWQTRCNLSSAQGGPSN